MNALVIPVEKLPEQFFVDLAVGAREFLDICDNYGISKDEAEQLEHHPVFQRRFRIAEQAVVDDGTAFRARCRLVVSNSIPHIMGLMTDPEVSPSVQLDAFKTLAKYGELEPAPKTSQSGPTGPQLVLNILPPGGITSAPVENVINLPAEADGPAAPQFLLEALGVA